MPDPDTTGQDSLKQHNLEVTLTDPGQAQAAVDSLRKADLEIDITVDSEEDKRAAMRGDMRDELEATLMGPGNVGPQTKAQTRGILKWVAIAGGTGALVMFLIGLMVWRTPVGLLSTAAIGATAGSVFGYVIGGFLGPRKHVEGYTDAEEKPVIGVHSDDREAVQQAQQILADVDSDRVDRVGPTGRPLGPPSKDTRPVRGETPT
jgi:hypothetical protein